MPTKSGVAEKCSGNLNSGIQVRCIPSDQKKRRLGASFVKGWPESAVLARIALAELVHTTAGIEHFLLARIEGMAVRTHFDLQIVPESRARFESIPATARDGNFFIVGMNAFFHDLMLWLIRWPVKMGASKNGREV